MGNSHRHREQADLNVVEEYHAPENSYAMQGALLVKTGSFQIQAGFASPRSKGPRAIFPTIVGEMKQTPPVGKSYFVGDEVLSRTFDLNISHPIHRGIVQDWDTMEKLLHHTFYNELRVAPEDHPILISDTPLNSIEHRERLLQLLCETFLSDAVRIQDDASLALILTGTTGLIVDLGHTFTQVVPLHNLLPIKDAIMVLTVGGQDIDKVLNDALVKAADGIPFSEQFISGLKHHQAKIALDFNDLPKDDSVEMPDGQVVSIGHAFFEAPEILFDPTRMNNTSPNLPDAIINSVLACPAEVREDLIRNVTLIGGCPNGLIDRLIKELSDRLPENLRSSLRIQRPYLNTGATYGGANEMLLYSNPPEKFFVTRSEYDEVGPSLIRSLAPLSP